MTPRRSLGLLLALAAGVSLSLVQAAEGSRAAVFEETSITDLRLPILFEATFPLNDLPPSGWTEPQKKEISYFLERMKKDDRIFLLVQATVDPIGSAEESGAWALALADAVAGRLESLGIPGDRVLILPGRRDASLFDGPDWGGFPALQTVTIRGLRGGAWLKRREVPVTRNEELPPPGTITIVEPAEGKTDRANHVLHGATGESVSSVAIVIGRETRTAAVYGGRFEVPVSLRPGENRIVVTGLDRFGRALRAVRDVVYSPPRPTIAIEAPAPGTTVNVWGNPVVTVKGTVRSRTPLQSVYLIQNGFPRRIPFGADGSFRQQAVLVTEEDIFSVEAVDTEDQMGISETRPVRAGGVPERPLMAILHWDEDDVDIDLHVTDRDGRHTRFDAPDVMRSAHAIPLAKLWLDNRRGFGPEVFSMESGATTELTIAAEYYRGKKPCRAYLTVVLFAGSPSRRMTRVFGPIAMSPAARSARIVRVSLPSGIIREPSGP